MKSESVAALAVDFLVCWLSLAASKLLCQEPRVPAPAPACARLRLVRRARIPLRRGSTFARIDLCCVLDVSVLASLIGFRDAGASVLDVLLNSEFSLSLVQRSFFCRLFASCCARLPWCCRSFLSRLVPSFHLIRRRWSCRLSPGFEFPFDLAPSAANLKSCRLASVDLRFAI